MTRENLEVHRHGHVPGHENEELLREIRDLAHQVQDLQRVLRLTDTGIGRTINSQMQDDIYSSCYDRPRQPNRLPPAGIWNGDRGTELEKPNQPNRLPPAGIWNGNGWGELENGGLHGTQGGRDRDRNPIIERGADRDKEPSLDPDRKPGQDLDRAKAKDRTGDNGNQDDPERRFEERITKAADYLSQHFNHLDLKRDGVIDKTEIDFALRHERDPEARQNLIVLRDNFDEILAGRHEGSKDGLTRADVQEMHHGVDRHNQIHDLARALQDGESPLFAALDSAKNGKFDGKISRDDLEKFILQSDLLTSSGKQDDVHTQANKELVAQMLRQWDDEKSPVYMMRDGGSYITIDTLSQALGKNLYERKPEPQVDHSNDVTIMMPD